MNKTPPQDGQRVDLFVHDRRTGMAKTLHDCVYDTKAFGGVWLDSGDYVVSDRYRIDGWRERVEAA